MNIYEQVVSLNHRLIRGEGITAAEQERFMTMIQERSHSPNPAFANGRHNRDGMYPLFLVPAEDESKLDRKKKLRLITGELPKTLLLSHNAYELEALRLAALWNSGQGELEPLLQRTAQRLEQACLSHYCTDGEYFGLRLVFLRYWHTWKPGDHDKINAVLHEFHPFCCRSEGMPAAKKADVPIFYMWLVLSELAQKHELAQNMIRCNSERLYRQFQQGWIVNPLNADWYNPIRKQVIQAALTKLPEYRDLAEASVLLRPDGRCYGVHPQMME